MIPLIPGEVFVMPTRPSSFDASCFNPVRFAHLPLKEMRLFLTNDWDTGRPRAKFYLAKLPPHLSEPEDFSRMLGRGRFVFADHGEILLLNMFAQSVQRKYQLISVATAVVIERHDRANPRFFCVNGKPTLVDFEEIVKSQKIRPEKPFAILLKKAT